MRYLFTLLSALAAAAPVAADVLPPGSKWVQDVAQFDNFRDYPAHVFFVWPRDLDRGRPGNSSLRVGGDGQVSLGVNPLAAGRAGGLFLFAVPSEMLERADGVPREEWFEGKTPGVLKSGPLATPVRSAPLSEPRSRFVTRYHVGMTKDALDLSVVSDERPAHAAPASAPGGPAPAWVTPALGAGAAVTAALTGLVIARVLRRRGAQSSAS
jgi:hypothetical protein